MRDNVVFVLLLIAACAPAPVLADSGAPVIGVSWSNFADERWKIDETAIKAELGQLGARYVGADAEASSAKQLTDVESLIGQGAGALIIIAEDAEAIRPAVAAAQAETIPVIAYDRLIEAPGITYLTFDNREVGRIEAREIYRLRPKGHYVFIKGAATDPNADFVYAGQIDVLKPAIDRGDITIMGDQYTDGWQPEIAQRNMDQILTRANNAVDAVIASNDGMAGGVIAALTAQGLAGIPVSGQDADRAALNRIARGLQTVSVWKDTRDLGRIAALIAVAQARHQPLTNVPATRAFVTPHGLTVPAILLPPQAITAASLDLVTGAGWISKRELCQGVTGPDAPSPCR